MADLTRRRVLLATAGAWATALAGCTGDGDGGDGDDDGNDGDGETDGGTTPGGGASDGDGSDGQSGPDAEDTPSGDLDLREANVTAVTVEQSGDASRFSVTLHHDDDGEDGYANWWQVETLAGERLGRRDLLHAHGTREFTRSETVPIPDGVECVVVRGHDQTHGYGGQAMLVSVASGATRAVRQGSEPASVADAACPTP